MAQGAMRGVRTAGLAAGCLAAALLALPGGAGAARTCGVNPNASIEGRSSTMVAYRLHDAVEHTTRWWTCYRPTGRRHLVARDGASSAVYDGAVSFQLAGRHASFVRIHEDPDGRSYSLWVTDAAAGRTARIAEISSGFTPSPQGPLLEERVTTAEGLVAFVGATFQGDYLLAFRNRALRLVDGPRGAVTNIGAAGARVTWTADGERHAASPFG